MVANIKSNIAVLPTFYSMLPEDVTASTNVSVKKAAHPFTCRLSPESIFDVENPLALVSAGFASLSLGIFTTFRITPMLLFLLLSFMKEEDDRLVTFRTVAYWLAVGWLIFVLFILIILAFVLFFSRKIKVRCLALLHPWGLLFLYLDVGVWLSLTIFLHIKTIWAENTDNEFYRDVYHLIVYFIFMYIDIFLYFVAYYVFATYFIMAELTAIEILFSN